MATQERRAQQVTRHRSVPAHTWNNCYKLPEHALSGAGKELYMQNITNQAGYADDASTQPPLRQHSTTSRQWNISAARKMEASTFRLESKFENHSQNDDNVVLRGHGANFRAQITQYKRPVSENTKHDGGINPEEHPNERTSEMNYVREPLRSREEQIPGSEFVERPGDHFITVHTDLEQRNISHRVHQPAHGRLQGERNASVDAHSENHGLRREMDNLLTRSVHDYNYTTQRIINSPLSYEEDRGPSWAQRYCPSDQRDDNYGFPTQEVKTTVDEYSVRECLPQERTHLQYGVSAAPNGQAVDERYLHYRTKKLGDSLSKNLQQTASELPVATGAELPSDKDTLHRQRYIVSYLENLDFGLFNYMTRFKLNEFLSILGKSTVEGRVTLNLFVKSKTEGDDIKERFLELYRQTEAGTLKEELNKSDLSELPELLRDVEGLQAVVYPTGRNKVALICDRRNVNNLAQIKTPFSKEKVEMHVGFNQCGYLLFGMVKVYLHTNYLCNMKVDIIVSATNQYLQPSGETARKLARAAGTEHQVMCHVIIKRYGAVRLNDVVSTVPGDLPSKYLLLGVCPTIQEQQIGQVEDYLLNVKQTYNKIFDFAFQSNMQKIALFFIGADDLSTEAESVVDILYSSLLYNVRKYFFHEENRIKEIHIADTRSHLLRALADRLDEGYKREGRRVIRQLAADDVTEAVLACLTSLPPTGDSPTASASMKRQESHRQGQFVNRGYLVSGAVKLIVCLGDITRMNVNTIVNPTDEVLSAREKVPLDISLAAGPGYQEAMKQVIRSTGILHDRSICTTSSGRLPCSEVVHMIGHMRADDGDGYYQNRQCSADLQKAFDSVIDYACTRGIQTIAIPLENGMFRIADMHVIEALYQSITDRLPANHLSISNLKVIYVVGSDVTLLSELLWRLDKHRSLSALDQGLVSELYRQVTEDTAHLRGDSNVSRLSMNPGNDVNRLPQTIQPRAGSSEGTASRRNDQSLTQGQSHETRLDSDQKRAASVDTAKSRSRNSKPDGHVTVRTRKSKYICCSCCTKRNSPRYEVSLEQHNPVYRPESDSVDVLSSAQRDDNRHNSVDDGGFGEDRRTLRHMPSAYYHQYT